MTSHYRRRAAQHSALAKDDEEVARKLRAVGEVETAAEYEKTAAIDHDAARQCLAIATEAERRFRELREQGLTVKRL